MFRAISVQGRSQSIRARYFCLIFSNWTESFSGLINEHRLRKRIEQLQEHRLLGIRTLIESAQYENEKKKREADKTLRKDKEKLDYLYSTPRRVKTVNLTIRMLPNNSLLGDFNQAKAIWHGLRCRWLNEPDIRSLAG
jgi:hypothetical protein